MLYSMSLARHACPGAIAILALGAITSLPAQASVAYISRSSSISVQACDFSGTNCNPQQVTDTAFDSFSQSLGTAGSTAYAQQQSTLSQGGVSVSMQALEDPDNFNNIANSAFSVTFDVNTPTAYSLSGNDSWEFLHSSAEVIFSVPPCAFFCSSSQQNGEFIQDTLTQSGVLQPGQYTLEADAGVNGSLDLGPPGASASAQLSLTPVPLPASGVLLALGLVPLMLLWVRRKASSGGLAAGMALQPAGPAAGRACSRQGLGSAVSGHLVSPGRRGLRPGCGGGAPALSRRSHGAASYTVVLFRPHWICGEMLEITSKLVRSESTAGDFL